VTQFNSSKIDLSGNQLWIDNPDLIIVILI